MSDPLIDIVLEAFQQQQPLIDAWEGSNYAVLRTLAPASKGALGQKVVSRFAARNGFYVGKSAGSESDLIIESSYVEVKTSLQWVSGEFNFEQIRDQRYEVIALLGFAPARSYLWFTTKELVWRYAKPQHTGAGGIETRWLQVKPDSPPPFLDAGHPADAIFRLRDLVSR